MLEVVACKALEIDWMWWSGREIQKGNIRNTTKWCRHDKVVPGVYGEKGLT